MITLAIVLAFKSHPWPVPVAVQAKGMEPLFFGPVLALGALGVWLSSRAGFASAPAITDGPSWRRLLLVSVALGVFFGATAIASDLMFNVAQIDAQVIGQPSMNVAFPASIPHYTFGAIMTECMTRWGPFAILMWLIGRVVFRGRHPRTVFWVLATLASLIEPIGQAIMMGKDHVGLAVGLAAMIFAGNLTCAELFRRYGWPAPLIERLALYAVWHVIWPLL
ncbi:MAG: hypothetical protein WAW96_15725 [Alphaproteobacteria bacterium]